jgi:hypothetical protein
MPMRTYVRVALCEGVQLSVREPRELAGGEGPRELRRSAVPLHATHSTGHRTKLFARLDNTRHTAHSRAEQSRTVADTHRSQWVVLSEELSQSNAVRSDVTDDALLDLRDTDTNEWSPMYDESDAEARREERRREERNDRQDATTVGTSDAPPRCPPRPRRA